MAAVRRRARRKSRITAQLVHVEIHMPQYSDDYAETPGYSGHNGGSFSDAGYQAGKGLFGFKQDVR